MEENIFLTVNEVSALLGVSVSYLERLKQYMGENKAQDIIDRAKAAEKVVEAQKCQRKVAEKGIEK